MATKMKRHRHPRRSPRTSLKGYERFLSECYNLGKKFGYLEWIEKDHLLWIRSELALDMKARPDVLKPEGRKRLRELDEKLKEIAPIIFFPRLPELAKRDGYPRSHWWWYMKPNAALKASSKRKTSHP